MPTVEPRFGLGSNHRNTKHPVAIANDVPKTPVVIKKAYVKEDKKEKKEKEKTE